MVSANSVVVAVADKRAPGMLGRRAQQIVQQPLDGPEVRSALEALASCYNAPSDSTGVDSDLNGLARHRDVRGDMQARGSQMDAEFVLALGAVEAAFAGLERSVDELDGQCSALRTQVNSALRTTAAAAEQAGALADERRELSTRLSLASDFLSRFSLAESDAERLSGSVVDSAYFAALDRVAATRAECQKLLGVGTQTAAHELMRELSAQEDAAYAALLRWVMAKARDLASDSAPVEPQLRHALRRLHAHPALLDAAAAEIARARREAVGRSFVAALVRGGAGGTPRPIDAHAGDAPRYVGDMLAWAHQACAEEGELLDALQGPPVQGLPVPGQADRGLLAVALEAVARPLELRVAQAVAETRAPAVLFRIDSLLSFYATLFAAVRLPADSAFMATVHGLCSSAHARLLSALDALLLDAVAAAFDRVPPTLDAPPPLAALLAVVDDILRLHEDSIDQLLEPQSAVGGAPVADHIARMLDRLRTEAHAAAADDTALRAYERTIFELNVLAPLLDHAVPFASLACWHSAQEASHTHLVDTLCRQLVQLVKEKSHLPFEDAEIQADTLGDCLARFNHCLKSASDLDVARLVARLADHALARTIAHRVTQMFVEEYAQLYARISSLDESKSHAVTALLLMPDTVATLL
ncbi:Golgi transport complex subunit 6 [Coemansia sp. S100]|nr:Golgi transport complex subunit 6 [Coemansia sp. S100]KAJ2109573.1 Golgi transport complex subunit 6 [Coemansia sp. S142-1]